MKTELLEQIGYPDWYQPLDEIKIRKILKHCKEHRIEPNVCAYYSDWDDFCSDWCDEVGCTKTEARSRLQDGKRTGEFLEFIDWGIIRFTT